MKLSAEMLFDCIGKIDDFFLAEAGMADAIAFKKSQRKRMVKYGVTGFAVSIGLAVASVAYWKYGKNKKTA